MTASGKQATVWDRQNGRRVVSLAHGDLVFGAALSPNGRRVATACLDGRARVWDAESGALVAEFEHEDGVRSVSFSPDGGTLLVGTVLLGVAPGEAGDDGRAKAEDPLAPGDVWVWDLAARRRLWAATDDERIDCHGRPVFSPDGRWVAVSGGRSGVAVFDAVTGHTVARWTAVTGVRGVSMVDFGRDEPLLLAAGDDGHEVVEGAARVMRLKPTVPNLGRPALPVFELETVRELLPNVSVRSAAISPDGRTVAVTFPHDEMLTWEPPTRYASGLWDVATGRQLLTFQQGERRLHTPGSYGTVSFSPDGRRVAAGFPSDGFTGVWAVEPADREAPKK